MNCLITVYGMCGKFEESAAIFSAIPKLELTPMSWSAMISVNGHFRRVKEAVEIFQEMQQSGVKVVTSSVAAMLHTYAHARMPDAAIKLYKSMKQQYGVVPNRKHSSIVIDALCRAGRLAEAEQWITTLQSPDLVDWTSLLGGC